MQSENKEYLTLKEAAEVIGKTVSNISYLVQYGRINRYNKNGELVEKGKSRELIYVSRKELLQYWESWKQRLEQRKELLTNKTLAEELAFFHVPERMRTKHVHRLHPYLGKFIPQLVEFFLDRFFEAGQTILDPFVGSGTTLVQANEMYMYSIGIDISEFNCLIAKVKTGKYNLEKVKQEINDMRSRTEDFSERSFSLPRQLTLTEVTEENGYLRKWFADQTLKELLFYRNLIKNYEYQDLLRIILCRTARSCRLVPHYDLASAHEPVREPYYCYKHKKWCKPIDSALGRLRYYSNDAIRRIEEFSKVRTNCESKIIVADSRYVRLEDHVEPKWLINHPIDGVFTSPPYVGQIDYHEQHRYAYELLKIPRRDDLEIGPKSLGKTPQAREKYINGMCLVFENIRKYIKPDGLLFVVANDRLNLYPRIFEESGLSVLEVYERPVENRTERDKQPYSEKIFKVKYFS